MRYAFTFLIFILNLIGFPALANEELADTCKNLRAISGTINHETFRTVSEINTACLVKGYETKIDLYSPGGIAVVGIGLYDILSGSTGQEKLSIHAYGYVASAATLVFLAGKERLISCNSYFMIHEARAEEMSGSVGLGDLAALSKKIERINETFAKIYTKTTGIDIDKIRTMMAEETTLTAEEAVRLGFATGTIPKNCK